MIYYINEASKKTSTKTNSEKISGFLRGGISLDKEKGIFTIYGINFDKFLLRLKEMYKYRGITKLFEKKYTVLSWFLYNKQKIHKDQLKISKLEVPLFFALELYKIFKELASFYGLQYYNKCADQIWDKTWISKYQRLQNSYNFEDSRININNLNRFVYKLKDYQLEFVKNYDLLTYTNELNGYVLGFKQGLGKTFTSIALAECLDKTQIIIVCPNTLKENWAYEIKSYYKIYNTNADRWIKDIYVNGVSKFGVAKNPKFIIVNQESIDKIYNKISKNKDTIIIVDECHNFRNINSERVKKLLHLRDLINCKDNLLMSGTPIKATPDEIVPVLRMIDPYFTEELALRYKEVFANSTVEVSNVVKERLSRIMYVKKKEDVLSLPEKNLEDLYWKIRNSDKYLLKNIRKDIIDQFTIEYSKKLEHIDQYRIKFERLIRKYSSADEKTTEDYLEWVFNKVYQKHIQVHETLEELYKSFLPKYIYPNIKSSEELKQFKFISAQYLYAKESAMGLAIGKILPPARTNCFKDIITENIDIIIDMINKATKKTILFTNYLDVADHLYKILLSKSIKSVKITGSTKDRMDEIFKFKESDDIDVLIATTQTLSTGVTLTEANRMMFFGVPYRYADFEQACDRIHRIGQTTPVDIYTILLDTKELNITSRIEEIMNWSKSISDSNMNFFI